MLRFINSNILILVFFVFFSACATVPSQEEPSLQVVSRVDINKYLGRWYEIARYPNWFQKNCYAVTADYELGEDGAIKVINRCKDRALNRKMREALGIAHIVDAPSNARLKVIFHFIRLDSRCFFCSHYFNDTKYILLKSMSLKLYNLLLDLNLS